MNSVWLYAGIMVCSVFMASLAQMLLKISANKTYPSKIREYMNGYVIAGYGLLLLSTLVTMIALKKIPLSWSTVIESIGYFFVFVMGCVFLKEKASKRKILGIAVIFAGVVIYLI
ncbi:MAG: multidrug ABC transporter [Eubacteriales bacterium]|nr:multidrug ABC transporter [Eubacteriales bacterium]